MCNPFGNDSICGMRPSLLAYDLTNMSFSAPMSAMNIHMNQSIADMQARPGLYMTSTMNFNNFTPYGSPSGGMDFLITPQYTINQWQWNNNAMANGGFNWGNINGGFNWGNIGWNGGNTTPTSPSNKSATTPEERAYQKKYNKLLSLVKQLASDDSKLPSARKEALDEIAKHPVGKNYEEQYKNLKAEYDKVSKTEIKKFLASNASIKFGIDGKDTTEENSFYGKLQSVGYEFTNSKVDSEISKLYDNLSTITDDQENYQGSDGTLLANIAGGTSPYDILDVISSWNTQKKDGDADDKRIINLIKKRYDALPAGDKGKAARDSVKTGVISPLVNALINRARGLKENLDSASQTKMTAAITKLETAYKNTKDKVDSNLSKAFDELYVLTRKAAIAQLTAEIKESFGTVDPDLFNDELFAAETKADLKAEGFDEAVINSANVVVQGSEDSGNYNRRVDETKPAREQLAAITGTDKALTKATEVTGVDGVTEAWIDNNTKKVYVLKENADGEEEIRELINPVVDADGKVTGGTVSTTKVSANDIVTASEAAKKEAKEVQAEKEAVTELIGNSDIMTKQATQATIGGQKYDVYKETKGDKRELVLIDGILYEYKNGDKGDKVKASDIENAYKTAVEKEEQKAAIEKYNIESDEITDANKIGINMQDCLHGYTTKGDWKEFKEELDKVDATNVMHVIAGYNAAGVGLAVDSDRFFTQLMSESHNKEDLEDIRDTVVEYVKEYANKKMEELDSRKKERVEKLISTLEDSSNSAEKLDDAMESLFSIFKIEDKTSATTGEQWATVGTMTAAGALKGGWGGAAVGAAVGLCSCWFSESNKVIRAIFNWFE